MQKIFRRYFAMLTRISNPRLENNRAIIPALIMEKRKKMTIFA